MGYRLFHMLISLYAAFLVFEEKCVNDVNRKLTHLNAVSHDILVGQIWLQDEPTAVEIIELNTSDECNLSTAEASDTRLNHAWSVTNNENLQQIEDNYKINIRARERRRLNHFQTTNTATNTSSHFINNNFYSDIIENQCIEDSQLLNHQVNCFTMINKKCISSDTSSDADIDLITSEDLTIESNKWDASKHPYEEETITYEPELDKETRTIWIYSFKNKHLLAEDDYEYELNDTATKEMSFYSTSSSTERDEEKTKDKSTNIRRLGSPIPPTYLPRLNLGQTLSTVSEVSEPNKQTSPNQSYKSPKTRFQKQRNSWVMTETEELEPTSGRKLEKSTNIVNWMALSPREKKRRSKEQGDKWVGSLRNIETLPFEASNQQETQDMSEQDSALRLQVDVDVHVSVDEKTPEKRSLGTPNSAKVILKSNTDKKSPIALLKCAPTDIKDDALDRGDHMKFGQTQQVLCLSGTSNMYETLQVERRIHFRRIGDLTFIEERRIPISPEVWEHEQKAEIETATYDYDTDKLKLAKENADRTWLKNNAPFLVPSSWAEYAETAEPALSIQMSNPNNVANRDPWYKRFLNSINCFK